MGASAVKYGIIYGCAIIDLPYLILIVCDEQAECLHRLRMSWESSIWNICKLCTCMYCACCEYCMYTHDIRIPFLFALALSSVFFLPFPCSSSLPLSLCTIIVHKKLYDVLDLLQHQPHLRTIFPNCRGPSELLHLQDSSL